MGLHRKLLWLLETSEARNQPHSPGCVGGLASGAGWEEGLWVQVLVAVYCCHHRFNTEHLKLQKEAELLLRMYLLILCSLRGVDYNYQGQVWTFAVGGHNFGEVFGFASICVLDTSSASLPFSLSSEKKIDWEWAAQSVHWGHWWSGCHDPPSSTQKTWRASMTWTPMPMMDGQVGGAFASGLSADSSAGGDHTLVSASCQGWQFPWHRVYREPWG